MKTTELNTLRDWLRWLCSEFNRHGLFFGHGTDNAFDEALALLAHVLHLDHSIIADLMDARLTEDEKKAIYSIAQKRIQTRQPLPYLTGEAFFAGLKFKVNPSVLIPRSPLAECIENQFEPWLVQPADRSLQVLDLCTGSGCIAIAIAAHLDAEVDAVDISADALKIAADNIQYHGLDKQVHLIQSDLFEQLPSKKYDFIISNPPYVSTAEISQLPPEYHHEPRLALEAEENGLSLVNRILKQAQYYLKPNGFIVVEVGHTQKQLIHAWPNIDFQWLEFERGGQGVFLLDFKQLEDCHDIKTS